jgi:hypothetical protein
MAQVMDVQIWQADRLARLAPDRLVEVGAAQPATLRADEDETALARLGEPLQVPADLSGYLFRECDGALASVRLGRVEAQPALARLD